MDKITNNVDVTKFIEPERIHRICRSHKIAVGESLI